MRYLLLSALSVMAFTLPLTADDKKDERIDAKLLIGKWTPKEKRDGVTFVVEMLKDGKATFTWSGGDRDMKGDGTYKIDGNKLTLTRNFEGTDVTAVLTVVKLTDAELVTRDESGQEETLLRVKDKK